MGVVDLGEDPDGHPVALKRLSLHGTPEELERARQRIRREAEVLQRLDHPAVVALRDVVDDGDDLVLVMDFLPGGNLAQRVADHGPMAAEDVETLLDRLLDGLAAAHRQGVVHRDIKPANVLFDAEGLAYLADFGAAIHRDATPGLTATEMVVGTPGFMAPEQARGDDATPASDVFSLAATVAFAASGSGPFGTADPRVLMLRSAAGRTEKLPRTLPPALRRRLAAMLDRDPTHRPSAAAARGGPEGTSPRSIVSVVSRPGRRRAGLLIVGIAVLLLGGTLAALSARHDDPNASPSPRHPVAITSTTQRCVDKPYQRCGGQPAPHTDGIQCLDGYADYDGRAADGCEAVPDKLTDDTPLNGTLRANLVPAGDVDQYRLAVKDKYQLRCDGRLRVTLTAPAKVTQKLTVLKGTEVLGTALSADGVAGTVSIRDPNCGRNDSTTLLARVQSVGSDRSALPYTLTSSGSY
jgi:hypothetical protein